MQSNKTVVLFLIRFFGTYLLLFVIYAVYLNESQNISGTYSCAPITQTVANQVQFLLTNFGYDAKIEQHPEEISLQLLMNDTLIARINEGCNAMSIIILFISFIVAFANKFKVTALYILFGSLIIYGSNIFRISFIAIALYKYPKYQDILHDYIFPGIIYGITFLLWFVWVRKFSKIAK